MLSRWILPLFILTFAGQLHAITRFPMGTCKLEGLLMFDEQVQEWNFNVNSGSNSETRFRLSPSDMLKGQLLKSRWIEVRLSIPKDTYSFYGEARLIKIIGPLNPYEEPKQYHTPQDVNAACK